MCYLLRLTLYSKSILIALQKRGHRSCYLSDFTKLAVHGGPKENKEGKHVKDSRKNEEKKTKTMEGK